MLTVVLCSVENLLLLFILKEEIIECAYSFKGNFVFPFLVMFRSE